jgi:hypothetical protein
VSCELRRQLGVIFLGADVTAPVFQVAYNHFRASLIGSSSSLVSETRNLSIPIFHIGEIETKVAEAVDLERLVKPYAAHIELFEFFVGGCHDLPRQPTVTLYNLFVLPTTSFEDLACTRRQALIKVI